VQPRRECRLTAKRLDFSEKLKERFLRQVFRFGRISYHPQAERVHAAVMHTVKMFKRSRVASLCLADSVRFRQFAGFNSSRSGHGSRPGRIRVLRCIPLS
jgi:hypothetical protein